MDTTPEVSASRHRTEAPRPTRRALVWLLASAALIHSLLIMVWVMPDNPTRQAVGAQRLADYVTPYFEQSWSVFAPTPRRGGENVVVRAYVGDIKHLDQGKVSPWFDVTADEDARIKYLVNPSRIHTATRRLGGNINAAMAKFSTRQKLLVRGGYVTASPDVLVARLKKLNRSGAGGVANIQAFGTHQEMLTRFLSMYARARWGRDVTMIQYAVGHRSVPNFNVRHDEKFLDVPFTYYAFGWRKVIGASDDAQDAFDGYVDRAPAGQLRQATAKKAGATPGSTKDEKKKADD